MLRKKLMLIILIISMFCLFSLTFNIQQVYATAEISILSHSGWLDSIGSYHVSGEVENVGDGAASFVRVTATFYDLSDTVVATFFPFAYLNVLLPGRKSPFEVILLDTTQAAKVHHYSLSVEFSATSPIPIGLEILSNSSYIDAVGFMHVVGEIKNVATGTATLVKVITTFYDQTGNVVATAFRYSSPSDISPGQKASFDLVLTHKNRVPLVATYALTAESNQYAIVPEFQTWSLTLLILITLTATMTTYKRLYRKRLLTLTPYFLLNFSIDIPCL